MARPKLVCDQCGYKAKSERGLKQHITRAHGGASNSRTNRAQEFLAYVQGLETEVEELRAQRDSILDVLGV